MAVFTAVLVGTGVVAVAVGGSGVTLAVPVNVAVGGVVAVEVDVGA